MCNTYGSPGETIGKKSERKSIEKKEFKWKKRENKLQKRKKVLKQKKQSLYAKKNNVYKNISPRKPKPRETLLNICTLTCYNKSIINSKQKG